MKNLILIAILFFPLVSMACLNKIHPSEFKKILDADGDTRVASLGCSGDDCLCYDGLDLSVSELSDEMISREVWSEKEKVFPCGDHSSCEALRFSHCQEFEGYQFFFSASFEAYCRKLLSTEMVATGKKILVEDQVKLQAKKAKELQESQEEAEIQAHVRKMDCGKKVKAALAVKNGKRALSQAKRKQQQETYKAIADYLDNGSLDVAKTAIQAIVPDGDLVRQEDLDFVLKHLNHCL